MRCVVVLFIVLVATGCRRTPPIEKPVADGDTVVKPTRTEPPTDSWKPDAKGLEQLDPPTETAGYLIRPPKGYKRVANKPLKLEKIPATVEMIWWESPPQPPDKKAFLIVSVATLVNPADPKNAPEQVLKDALAAMHSILDNWSQTPLERGMVGGVPFVRARFAGTHQFEKKSFMKGVAYVGKDGNRMIQLSTRGERMAESDDLMGPVEAGVLTFQRK